VTSPYSTRRFAAFVLVSGVLLTGCPNQLPREYNSEVKRNFVDACTEDLSVESGTRVTEKLAPNSYCECVYTFMKDRYKLSFDDMKAYEDKVASAKDGEQPDMPDKLAKAIADADASANCTGASTDSAPVGPTPN